MTRLLRWIVLSISIVTFVAAVFSLLVIYRTPVSLNHLAGAQFALGFLLGGCLLALIFLIGDWIDAGPEYNQ